LHIFSVFRLMIFELAKLINNFLGEGNCTIYLFRPKK
jgi:hypothetical protein